MPSPVGHVLGGVAVGCLAGRRPSWGFLALCGVAAALADADFLLPIRHRGISHSIGAAALAGAAAWAGVRLGTPRRDAARIGLAIGAAYATHVLFDWLGADSSAPRGVMALWPFSTNYVISDVSVFHSVERRYWIEGFWRRTAIGMAREVAILAPLAGLAWWWRRRVNPGRPAA
jgi:inner membrane protein